MGYVVTFHVIYLGVIPSVVSRRVHWEQTSTKESEYLLKAAKYGIKLTEK